MIRALLAKAEKGVHLTADEAAAAFSEIIHGPDANPVLVAAFLTALQMNGPTVAEVAGAARALRAAGVHLTAPADAVDIVGTGGDGAGTFNVSTTAALIAAGAGATVVKHGNRASTSRCGSADCLAALGYNLAKSTADVQRSIDEHGIGFCFANACHPALRFAAAVRRELPYRTIFNLLGPLANPAGVTRLALGVYAPDIVPLYVGALKTLGATHALVFCGPDGLDELGLSGVSRGVELFADGHTAAFSVDPRSIFGAYAPRDAIAGGSSAENARLTREVLAGSRRDAYRDAACLNAAAALVVGGRADTLAAGVAQAAAAIDSGAAWTKLEQLIGTPTRAGHSV